VSDAGPRLYRVSGRDEILRRRALLPKGRVVEVWQDCGIAESFWVGEESKALLDTVAPPLPSDLAVAAAAVPVYYGPKLCDLDSLPREESTQARVLSAHGIAAAWITLDRFGERNQYVPTGPDDPVFHLRRVGGGAGHVWRLFRKRPEAIVYMGEAYGADSEGAEWATKLPVEDFDALIARHGERRR
jgi:hypothetical protein